MYGKIVTLLNGTKVWVWCVPSTPDNELQELALHKYELYIKGVIKDLMG